MINPLAVSYTHLDVYKRQSQSSVCTVYLNQKGEHAAAESDIFFMGILSQKEKNGLETAEITVIRQRDQKQLFTMTIARYVPEQAE